MSISRSRRLLAGVVSTLLLAPLGAVLAAPAHATTGSQIAAIANGQIGSGSTGPCGLGPAYAGYTAPSPPTSQGNSCASRGSNSGESHAWCADFAGWVWNQAGVTVDGNLNNLANSFYDYGQAHGTWSTTPHVGDAVYFDSSIKGGYGHVAIVTAVHSNGTFTEVGGNENGLVGSGATWNDPPSSQVVWTDKVYDSNGNWTGGYKNVYVMGFASPAGGTNSPSTLSITGGIANNGAYSGTVTITVSTSTVPDNNAVYLHIDGNTSVPVMSGSGTSYSYTLNTNTLAPGTHTIYAGATFGGAQAASPTDAVTLNPQVQLFAQTPTDLGVAAANYAAGGWSTFKSVYSAAGGSPGTVANYSSTYTEPNNALHTVANVGGHLYIADGNPTTGTWSGWQDLEATGAAGALGTVSQLTTTAIGDKLYVVALVGGQIYEASGDYDAGKWSGWANVSTTTGVGGSVFSEIAAATTGNTLHLFALNSDGNIYNADGNFTAGTWSSWQNVNVSGAGGTLPAAPTQIVARSRGLKVELLALVDNGGVGNVYQGGPDYGNSTWSTFGNLSAATGAGGSNFSSIAAAVTGNTLHVFALNSDGNIYNADGNYDSGQWSNWMEVTTAGAAGTMPGGYSNLVAAGN